MKKFLILFITICAAPNLWSQNDTVWIAPNYLVTIDSNEWEMLYDAPDPLMVYHSPIPQQIVHRTTGMAILFQVACAVEAKPLKWLSEMQEKEQVSKTTSKYLSMKDHKKFLLHTLFHKPDPLPAFDTAQYEAYTNGSVVQKLANAYLWRNEPYYLFVTTPNFVSEENQKLLLDILLRIQTTQTEQMDRAMRSNSSRGNLSSERLKNRTELMRQKINGSLFERSKQDLNELSDETIGSLSDSTFSFVEFDTHMRQITIDAPEPTMVFSHVKSPLPNQADIYHQYHIHPLRLSVFYELLGLYTTWKQFPSDIVGGFNLPFQMDDSVHCYQGYNQKYCYLLSYAFDAASVERNLDSIPLNLLEYDEGAIRKRVLTYRTSKYDVAKIKKISDKEAVFMISATNDIKQKDKIAHSFDDLYFYAPRNTKKRLVHFSPSNNLQSYDALIQYNMDENDQRLIDHHFASRDTVRYYFDCDLRDDSPDIIFFKGINAQELKTLPAKRLYSTSLFTTDLNANGLKEYWQLHVSNGKVVTTNFYAVSTSDDSLNTAKYRKSLMKLPQIKKLISVSLSTTINNHQLLCRANNQDVFADEIYSTVEAIDDVDNSDRKARIAADTTIYQYPHREAYFTEDDRNGEHFVASQMEQIKFPFLSEYTRYKISFIIEKDGSLSHISIRSIDGTKVYQMEAELLECIWSMPKWQPATVEDLPVRSYGAVYFGIYVKK